MHGNPLGFAMQTLFEALHLQGFTPQKAKGMDQGLR
jgi:hypothetical protein